MFTTKEINDRHVIAPKGVDDRPYMYHDLLPHAFCNIIICGRKSTGKSIIVQNILLQCVCNKTVVRLFSQSMHADHTTDKTIEKLKKRGIDVEEYEGMKYNLIEQQLQEIKAFMANPKNKKKYESYKHQFLLAAYVFDDFRSNFDKYPEICNLFSKNRHFKTLVFISSQKWKDAQRIARENCQVVILTKGLSDVVLKDIYEELPLHVTFKQFQQLYEFATTKYKYSFLFIDCLNSKFRINLNEEIII